MHLTVKELARMLDLSAVRANTGVAEVRALAAVALQYRPICVYTLPCFTPEIKALLEGQPDIGIGGNVGFPSGGELTAIKVVQARALAELGCAELDMVINIGLLRSGRYAEVEDDIRAVVGAADVLPVKVILEVTYLTDDEIRRGCELCIQGGAAFVKTGTGWAARPTTVEHIRLIKKTVGDAIRIKASGGIRDLRTLLEMRGLGATRFGISRKSGIKILQECAAETSEGSS